MRFTDQQSWKRSKRTRISTVLNFSHDNHTSFLLAKPHATTCL